MQEKTLLNQTNSTSNIHSMDFGSVSYDIFGSPYQKSGFFLADDSLDFGYLGKPYNADTELYDYGFRDYSPNIARFTTVDPIRDGRNWYSYVVNDPVNYVDLWGLQCKSESDGDNKGFLSWLIPDPDEMTETEARAWIDKFVCSNKFFPICAEMYSKSMVGDSSTYEKGPDSAISKEMASDSKAYVNKRIKSQLADGVTSGGYGENGPGTTGWSKLDLKLSLGGGCAFTWQLESYDEKTKIAEVLVNITDDFDFNRSEGIRDSIAEQLTSLGRKAKLTEYTVSVTYRLSVKVSMPGK